jgi:DNA-binding response OmpR family regulator
MSITGHILVIDDEAVLRQTITRILQGAGHEVTTAATGREGLAYLAQQTFDLVYLDIRLPDISGLEVLKIVSQKYTGIPVLLFTAQPDMNSAIQAMRDGAIDYLLKPLKPQALIDRTQTLLARQEKERRKREIQIQIEALQLELKGLENIGNQQPGSGGRETNADERFLIRGKLSLDLHARRVTIGNKVINLPPTSFDYLLVLARHSPNIVDYQTLVTEAQGYQAEPREAQELVKWHIHHIRQAIEPDEAQPTYIINVRGTGYRLVAD